MAIRPKIVDGNSRIPQQLKPPQLTQKDRNKGMGKHSAFVNFTFTTHTYHFIMATQSQIKLELQTM
jgi:hypothetical protein